MALGDDYYDDWFLISDKKRKVRRVVEENGVQTLQYAILWTIIQSRYEYNITDLTTGDEFEDSKQSFSLETGPDSSVLFFSTSRNFINDGDERQLQDPLIGQYDHSQVWVYRSEWTDDDLSIYTPSP